MSMLVPQSESDLPVMPSVRKILAARTVESCHAALVEAMRLLQTLSLRPVNLACEIAVPAPGRPLLVWRAGGLFGQGTGTPMGFQDWFARASRQPARFCAFDELVCGVVGAAGLDEIGLFVALLAECDPDESPALEAALADVAAISAQCLHRLRKDEERRLIRERGAVRGATHTELLKASVDLLWEETETGALHVTQVFNNRADLARHFEGRPLAGLTVADGKSVAALAAHSKALRSIRLDPVPGAPKDTLYITVCLPPAPAPEGRGRLTGTLSTGPDIAMDRLALDAQLLQSMVGARTREDELRHEIEAMLLGLRALLSPAPFRDKLEELARHLAGAIGGDVIEMIQQRPGEKPRLMLSLEPLPSDKAAALQRVLAAATGRDVTVLAAGSDENALAAMALDAKAGDIALIAIPYQAEQFHLACRARRGFGTRDVRLAERFSLLLRQALVLRDDQDRVIHAAKLSALGQISTNIAHELRQPLNTISIAMQNIEMLIEREAITPQILKEKVDRVLQQIDRACRVMDKMRRFGRKSGGNYKSVPLYTLVQSAVGLMQRVAENQGVAIDMDVAEDQQVLADELEIEQVLVNLIQNAVDAISEDPARPGRIRIWSRADPDDPDGICLNVEDNGAGFSPEVLQHALDAFFTTKAEGKGTGLGLSISHAILREHGGRLELGNGSHGGRVTLYLRRPDHGKGASSIRIAGSRRD
jgi:signal transduction histidine kinase